LLPNFTQTVPNQLTIDSTQALSNGIESILRYGRVNPEEWLKSVAPIRDEGMAVVATIPLMLFHHENWEAWSQTALAISRYWQLRGEIVAILYTISNLISKSLTETLNPSTAIGETIDRLGNLPPLVETQLRYIDTKLEQPTSLHQIVSDLLPEADPIVTATTLAIYCWLSSVEDYNLTMMRSWHCNYQTNLTSGIAGLLSGSYLGSTGIPHHRSIAIPQRDCWLRQSQQLYDTWAGVYDPATMQTSKIAAIASPNLIQSSDRR
jgi:hypothetical protein